MESDIDEKSSHQSVFPHIFMVGLSIIILFPLYFKTVNSFKAHDEYINNMTGMPHSMTVQNYIEAFWSMVYKQYDSNCCGSSGYSFDSTVGRVCIC